MTELSTEEAAVVQRFEAAADAEESLRERVAVAIAESERSHDDHGFPCLCGWDAGWGRGWEDRVDRHKLQAKTDAAIAVLRGGLQ